MFSTSTFLSRSFKNLDKNLAESSGNYLVSYKPDLVRFYKNLDYEPGIILFHTTISLSRSSMNSDKNHVRIICFLY